MVYGPYACSSSVYDQSLSAAHAFAMVWRLICAFCHSSLTSYDVNYLLVSHSLRLASFFKGWALFDRGLSLISLLFAPSIVLLPFLLVVEV